jgi:hypothetical protein
MTTSLKWGRDIADEAGRGAAREMQTNPRASGDVGRPRMSFVVRHEPGIAEMSLPALLYYVGEGSLADETG